MGEGRLGLAGDVLSVGPPQRRPVDLAALDGVAVDVELTARRLSRPAKTPGSRLSMSFCERSSFRTNLAFEAKRLSSNAPTLMRSMFLFASLSTLALMAPFQPSTFHTTDSISSNMWQLLSRPPTQSQGGQLLPYVPLCMPLSASGNAETAAT